MRKMGINRVKASVVLFVSLLFFPLFLYGEGASWEVDFEHQRIAATSANLSLDRLDTVQNRETELTEADWELSDTTFESQINALHLIKDLLTEWKLGNKAPSPEDKRDPSGSMLGSDGVVPSFSGKDRLPTLCEERSPYPKETVVCSNISRYSLAHTSFKFLRYLSLLNNSPPPGSDAGVSL